LTFFNLQNPPAARANILQTAAEDFQAIRLMQSVSIGGAKLDTSHLVHFGHSQGSLTAAPFLASAPEVTASVLSGAGAVFYKAILGKTQPVDIPVLMKSLLQLDEVDDYHPLLQLAQGYLEPADPIVFAGQIKKHLYISQGFDDHYAPDDGIEALALAVGAVPVGTTDHPLPDFAVAGVKAASSASANHDGKTVVLRQFDEKSGSDGHFVDFEVPEAEAETAAFLQAAAAGQTPTVTGQ
jgi:hypothetical protein